MSQVNSVKFEFKTAKEYAKYIPSYRSLPGDAYYQRFISMYCIILPNGIRIYPRTYAAYKHVLVEQSDPEVRAYSKQYFKKAEQIEESLEEAFSLPNEYMLGVHEVYTKMAYAACLAYIEFERLARAVDVLDQMEKQKFTATEHLDLCLTTTLHKSRLRFESDICKILVKEPRVGCKCLLCVPPLHGDLFNHCSDSDKAMLARVLHINPSAVNVYIPFRHDCYKENSAHDTASPLDEALREILSSPSAS
jgi:hypothetical protein